MKVEKFFIFIVDINDTCHYLTDDGMTFSESKDDAMLMTEAEASDGCGEYGGGCGSIVVEE